MKLLLWRLPKSPEQSEDLQHLGNFHAEETQAWLPPCKLWKISYFILWRENILLLLTTWYKHRPSPQQEARKWLHQKQCYTRGLAGEKENFRIFLTPFWILPQTHICLGCPNEYLLQIQWCRSQRIQQQTQSRFQLARQKISSQLFAKKFSGSSRRIFGTWSSCSKM